MADGGPPAITHILLGEDIVFLLPVWLKASIETLQMGLVG